MCWVRVGSNEQAVFLPGDRKKADESAIWASEEFCGLKRRTDSIIIGPMRPQGSLTYASRGGDAVSGWPG